MNGVWVYAVAVPVTFALLIGGFLLATRRLLGLHVSATRTVLAAAIGFSAYGLVGRIATRQENSGAFVALALGTWVLVAMTFLVLAEALVPTGSLPRLLDWPRAIRRRLARTRRYSRIAAIAFRHGLGPYLRGQRRVGDDAPGRRERLARSLRLALEEGGATFVKLGQVLSTRRDLLPEEFVTELARLQHQVAPAPWPRVREVLAEELGAEFDTVPEEVFAAIDPEPLAAASIAQVHRATLRDGTEVVVKVQRPGIRPVVERDLDIVTRIGQTLQARTRWGGTLGTADLAEGFAAALREELDFRIEARNLAAAVTRTATTDDVRVPAAHRDLCTARVLVVDWLDGVPLGDAGPLVAELGLDRAALARTLLGCLLRQVMFDGVFHADPHPGNVLLLRDGRLGLLDFGSVGRLDGQVRTALQHLLLAIDRSDRAALHDALLEVVVRPDEIDEQGLERALGRFMARHLGAGGAPDLEMFTDLFRIVSGYGLAVPPEVAAVFRALATVEGTLGQLAPGFDIVAESRGFAEGQLAARLSPTSLRQTATDELVALLPVLRRLPRRAERITAALEQGRFSANVRLFADERDRRFVTTLLHRVLTAFLSATTGIMAVLLLGTAGGPSVTPTVSLYQVFGYYLLMISAGLALRVLFLIFRSDR